jgi:hypothetical protein
MGSEGLNFRRGLVISFVTVASERAGLISLHL